jgi:hypothetical protein
VRCTSFKARNARALDPAYRPTPGALYAGGASGTISAEEGCRLGRSRDLCSELLRAVSRRFSRSLESPVTVAVGPVPPLLWVVNEPGRVHRLCEDFAVAAGECTGCMPKHDRQELNGMIATVMGGVCKTAPITVK